MMEYIRNSMMRWQKSKTERRNRSQQERNSYLEESLQLRIRIGLKKQECSPSLLVRIFILIHFRSLWLKQLIDL